MDIATIILSHLKRCTKIDKELSGWVYDLLGRFMSEPVKIIEGRWENSMSWEFYLDDRMPPRHLCTAVVCLAITQDDQVVLTRNYRGWEMPGGHIEKDRGESIEDTLLRETLEEGGFVPEKYALFGYRKITLSEAGAPDQRRPDYPFPTSFIPHFLATTTKPLVPPSGLEIIESRTIPIDHIDSLEIVASEIVKAGLAVYIDRRDEFRTPPHPQTPPTA